MVKVREEEIRRAMRYYYTDTHNVAEAAAARLAALLKEQEQLAGKIGKKN